MIDHFGICVRDLKKSQDFYLKTLGPLGYVQIISGLKSVSFGVLEGARKSSDPGGEFWLSEGSPMSPRVHFAFNAASREEVDAFFAAGISAGGVENGVPGLHLQYHADYYAAYLLDPDGYNIEAVCHNG
jgi:catechol 2,3-dioxygenase-like lactoylglutathione lyase family enzyme